MKSLMMRTNVIHTTTWHIIIWLSKKKDRRKKIIYTYTNTYIQHILTEKKEEQEQDLFYLYLFFSLLLLLLFSIAFHSFLLLQWSSNVDSINRKLIPIYKCQIRNLWTNGSFHLASSAASECASYIVCMCLLNKALSYLFISHLFVYGST